MNDHDEYLRRGAYETTILLAKISTTSEQKHWEEEYANTSVLSPPQRPDRQNLEPVARLEL